MKADQIQFLYIENRSIEKALTHLMQELTNLAKGEKFEMTWQVMQSVKQPEGVNIHPTMVNVIVVMIVWEKGGNVMYMPA